MKLKTKAGIALSEFRLKCRKCFGKKGSAVKCHLGSNLAVTNESNIEPIPVQISEKSSTHGHSSTARLLAARFFKESVKKEAVLTS